MRSRFVFCGLALGLSLRFSFAAPAAIAPQCAPGWTIELVAEAPRIQHPSVVCSAPDGRVFVAEDPMDISAPSAALALGRIICLHPDGRTSVFATNLYAVFGMQYLEGWLYVLHNPKFTRFRDRNGVAGAQEHLIESTHPNPSALDWNDHVPANFKLAMDGYFYVAVGDKGMYRASGRDGKTISLHGGGVVRLRPDGTQLEVFCTGVRNILDVALNAEDEIFTYDNTDEQLWMSRVSHMVDRGYYGYPYDFLARPPFVLDPMADYGPGAATGGLAYNEASLPEEYSGNLFLADFGKRQVLRLEIERAGATYRVRRRHDMFHDMPPDFRPVGIALGADASSIYICDWHHADTKENVVVGRLWRLQFTGALRPSPMPEWYVPAAQGELCRAPTEDLVAALSHPAQRVRLVAQRRLADRAAGRGEPHQSVVRQLNRLLADAAAPEQARWHALWTLDAVRGKDAAFPAARSLLASADPSVARQMLRQLGGRAVIGATSIIAAQLRHADASVRFQAATALGRIAAADAIAPLCEALGDPDALARFAVFTALNHVGRARPAAWKSIVARLNADNAAVRDAIRFALRETYDATLARELAAAAHRRGWRQEARAAAFALLAEIYLQPPPWKGEWWAYHPVNQPPPAKNTPWTATDFVGKELDAGLDSSLVAVRRASIAAAGAGGDARFVPRLRARFAREVDPELKVHELEALARLDPENSAALLRDLAVAPPAPNRLRPEAETLQRAAIRLLPQASKPAAADALDQLLRRTGLSSNVIAEALTAAGRVPLPRAEEVIAPYLSTTNVSFASLAFDALATAGTWKTKQVIRARLADASPQIRAAAARAAGRVKDREAYPHLLKLARAPELVPEVVGALAAMPSLEALPVFLRGLTNQNFTVREGSGRAIAAIAPAAWPELAGQFSALSPAAIAPLLEIYRKHLPAAQTLAQYAAHPEIELERYRVFALDHPGDARKGGIIFFDSRSACAQCHRARGQGGAVGPDLSSIGTQYSKADLIDAILRPSARIREGYQQVLVQTRDEQEWSGRIITENAETVSLLDAAGQTHQIRKQDLSSRKNSERSLMPEGIHAGISPAEFADLVAYLVSLRDEPK